MSSSETQSFDIGGFIGNLLELLLECVIQVYIFWKCDIQFLKVIKLVKARAQIKFTSFKSICGPRIGEGAPLPTSAPPSSTGCLHNRGDGGGDLHGWAPDGVPHTPPFLQSSVAAPSVG